MSERGKIIQSFLNGCGWGEAVRKPLAADASFRKYERLSLNGNPAVLMDAPPPQEDVRPFVCIADHLLGLGYSAPEIFARDEEVGLLLLEDLGNDTYTRLLQNGADEGALYALAVDLLIDLHKKSDDIAMPKGLPPYGNGRLLDEVFLLPQWYMPAIFGDIPSEEARRDYGNAWLELFPKVHALSKTLVLRDFHVDNLMRLADRDGLQACGLLDFQDAVAGCAAYDLMSLLEDARRDLAPALIKTMLDRYHAAFPEQNREAFDTAYAILGAGRHAKVIGIFTRLWVRDGKDQYLEHIPRVWRLFENSLDHPALAAVKAWVEKHIPVNSRKIPSVPSKAE